MISMSGRPHQEHPLGRAASEPGVAIGVRIIERRIWGRHQTVRFWPGFATSRRSAADIIPAKMAARLISPKTYTRISFGDGGFRPIAAIGRGFH